MEGINRVVRDTKHRKELVAGGLDEFLTEGVRDDFRRRCIINVSTEYCSLSDRLGGRANDLWAAYFGSTISPTFKPMQLLMIALQELPQVRLLTYPTFSNLMSFQIVFTLQVVKKPASIPVSLASLHLLQQSINTFAMRMHNISSNVGSIATRLSSLRRLHEAENIPNKVVDGTTPFPENAQSISDGISLEFRYFIYIPQIRWRSSRILRDVSFRYPGSDQYALRGISFKVLPGQLCVRPANLLA